MKGQARCLSLLLFRGCASRVKSGFPPEMSSWHAWQKVAIFRRRPRTISGFDQPNTSLHRGARASGSGRPVYPRTSRGRPTAACERVRELVRGVALPPSGLRATVGFLSREATREARVRAWSQDLARTRHAGHFRRAGWVSTPRSRARGRSACARRALPATAATPASARAPRRCTTR